MNNLMSVLYRTIDNAHDYKTFSGRAPQAIKNPDGTEKSITFPYVVYKLMPVAPTEKDRDDYNLVVSCWDKSEDNSLVRVQEIADDIRNSLIRFRHLDHHQLIIASRPQVGYVPDPDELIKRFDVMTILKTYRREVNVS